MKSESYLLTYRQANVPLQYFLKYIYREYYFTFLFLNITKLLRVLIMLIRTKEDSVELLKTKHSFKLPHSSEILNPPPHSHVS